MKLLLKIILLLFASIIFSRIYAQTDTPKIDSFKLELKKTDGVKSIPIYIELSIAYADINLDESLNNAIKANKLAANFAQRDLLAQSDVQVANAYYKMARFKIAIQYYENALDYYYDQKSSDIRIYIYTQLGHSEKMLNNLDNALFYYQKPLNLYLAKKNNKISTVYNHIGKVYKLQNQYQLSLEYHQKALKESKLTFDQKETAYSLNLIGSLYWNKNEYDSCLYYYEKSLEIYRELTDTLSEAIVLSNIGVFYKSIGEFQKALDYNQKSLELRMTANNTKAIADSYNIIGSIYLSANDSEKALEFYLISLEKRESIGDLLGMAQTQNNIALVYKNKNNFDSALDYFNKSLFNYYQIGNLSHIANSINQIGSIYKKQNKYDLALKNYLDALKIKQKLKNENDVASILNNVGIIYSDIGNYSRALDAFTKSLEIKREFGLKKDIAYALHIIANTYLKLKNYDKALSYYNESLKIRKEIGDKVNTASSLKNIGNTYLELKDYQNAIRFFNEALALREQIGDVKGISDILNNIGNYYLEINDYSKALVEYNKAVETGKKTGDKLLIALCFRKIGTIYLIQNNYNEGVNFLYNSLQIGKEIKNLELIKNAYYELFKYYNLTQNSEKALENYINYTIINDSINTKQNSQRLIEIQMNFELEESYNQINKIEDEITELNAEKKLRELELKKQKNVRNYLIIIVLVALISASIISVQFFNKRKTNILLKDKIQEVNSFNQKLQESEENLKILNATKDKFFSIIAHDLRNPFNALHGLTRHLIDNFDSFSKEEIKPFVEIIYNSADDQLELLENLLYWSRTQRGKIQFNPRTIDLNEIITKNFDLLKMSAERKQINLVNEVTPEYEIFADYDMIMAIMRNLTSNAIKFSNENSFVSIKTSESKNFIEISVLDNGIGISQENMQKLFRIDIHHTTSGTSDEQGSGLGLILCKEFVEAHKGKIWVESELNKGSIFKFTVPKTT
jgi:signal transduction histidine kinase